MHDLIDSQEMYLRTVLELEEEGITALRARLSERLQLSAPAVSEGVTRLEAQGLVALDNKRTVTLTSEGRAIAERVMRKHRLIERLLVDVLEIPPEYVHEEACRWEHVISDRVEERLSDFLGAPTTSPYGNPIPGTKYANVETHPLSNVGDSYVVLHSISEQLQANTDVIRALSTLGMVAGTTVSVRTGLGGVVLRYDDAEMVLSPEQAELIHVINVNDA
ncbi:MAG: metal-dependent transcriptional regulator [Nitriliruptoraceae bacterium]